ncbi:MAG: sigma 54-interacting transcriptional regulator [Proteobacteria bacterium]|nr:sigma 54-interacting transcriptional regulator [Pseudomonadota bacterium]
MNRQMTFPVDLENSEKILELILKALDDIVEYELAVILKLKDDHTLAVKKTMGPLADRLLDHYQIDLKKRDDIARLIEQREPYLVGEEDSYPDTYHDIIDLPQGHSCLVAPLYLQEKPLGMLTLDHRACDMFSPGIIRFINTLAKLISIIIAQSDSSEYLKSISERLTEERNLLLSKHADLFSDVVGNSSVWNHVLDTVRIVAGSDLSVLIQGETGTGKEQIAHMIHKLSPRSDKQFIALNCSALSPGLAESELFGHEKGAFTSAINRRKGRFELADGGTLFLDEIGDLPMEVQPKLLRALQESSFERVGGEETIKSRVRIIAASHVNLKQAAVEKRFREDLYYRIGVFPITLPPLRDRKEDVVLLAEHFLKELRNEAYYANLHLSGAAVECLLNYNWPGNVRELQNTIRRSALVAGGSRIEPSHLALKELARQNRQIVSGIKNKEAKDSILFSSPNPDRVSFPSLDDAMRDHITSALKISGGKLYGKDGAAELLGVKPTTLQSRMKKLGLQRN